MPSRTTTNRTKKDDTATTEQTAIRQSRGVSVNHTTLLGRLVAAPELRQTASGKHVTTVRVATNGRTRAEFHDVVLWNQLADFACTYLGKGRLVYIDGRLQSRTWEASDGTTRRTVEVVANRLQALPTR
jgi:single-strand DNA-binding protein